MCVHAETNRPPLTRETALSRLGVHCGANKRRCCAKKAPWGRSKTTEIIEVKQKRLVEMLKFIVFLGLGATIIFCSRLVILTLP